MESGNAKYNTPLQYGYHIENQVIAVFAMYIPVTLVTGSPSDLKIPMQEAKQV